MSKEALERRLEELRADEETIRQERYAIYAALMLYLILVGLVNKHPGFAIASRYLVPILGIVAVIAFDVAYRLGMTGSPLFVRTSNDAYHWRVTRSAENNFRNASLRYYGDFTEIEKIIEPHSLFLADVATSYYVAAALPLYAANTHAHHSREYPWS